VRHGLRKLAFFVQPAFRPRDATIGSAPRRLHPLRASRGYPSGHELAPETVHVPHTSDRRAIDRGEVRGLE
jgi:hypothetical protein